ICPSLVELVVARELSRGQSGIEVFAQDPVLLFVQGQAALEQLHLDHQVVNFHDGLLRDRTTWPAKRGASAAPSSRRRFGHGPARDSSRPPPQTVKLAWVPDRRLGRTADSCGGGSGLEEIPEAAFRAGEWPAPRRGRLLGSVEPAPEPDAGVPALPSALRCGRRAGPLARTSEHAAVVAGPRPSQLASLRGCPAFRFGPLAAALRLSARGDDLFARS